MSDTSSDDRYHFEFPDEAGYPDGVGTLSQDQKVLIDEVIDDHADPTLQLLIVNETASERYDGIVGDRAIGSLTYKEFGSRVVLLATTVDPDYRGRGVATQLVQGVLDGLRAAGKTVTIECPIVRTFIDRNPAYEDLVDPVHPGVSSRH